MPYDVLYTHRIDVMFRVEVPGLYLMRQQLTDVLDDERADPDGELLVLLVYDGRHLAPLVSVDVHLAQNLHRLQLTVTLRTAFWGMYRTQQSLKWEKEELKREEKGKRVTERGNAKEEIKRKKKRNQANE